MLGTERFTKSVKKGTTVEEFKESLKFIHKRSQIAAVANHEGYIIAQEDDLEEWINRTSEKPFRILPTKQVQVIIDFRGTHQHFVVSENASEKGFRQAVRIHLRLPTKTKLTVRLLGQDRWEIKAGHTYAVMEPRKMQINLHDLHLKTCRLEVPGNLELHEVCEVYRAKVGLPAWFVITIARSDGNPFWIEDKGEYTVETRYDPNLDTRPLCGIRIDTKSEGQSNFIECYRCDEIDPVAIWQDLVSKYGFANIPITQMTVEGSPSSGAIRYRFKHRPP
jgi:hypothetical protein